MHRWGNKKDMSGDDPPYLTVGTEVSAKYKGAFCEAKIRKVVKTVKCKVQYKNEQGSALVNEEQIKGVIMPGASVEIKQLEKKEAIEGTIVKIQDLSQYTVVFDDGDIATLRRTALCLKSGRHFAESETLDQLPLTHPEHFSTPVVSGIRGSRRRDDMDDNSDEEEKREPKIEKEEDMGKVVCVEIGDKKKTKDNWFPGLIVAPNAQDSVKIDVEDEYLVRSFKDGRYYTVPKSEATEFTREVGIKVDNPTLKQAVEKAISFLDKSDLPPHWDRDQLFGVPDFPSDIDASDTDSTDDEPREEKDHFVAQLYKFMDDRGTPINKGPIISSKDVDLYKLFKLVYKLGGYNRVTNRNQWRSVTVKLGYSTNQMNNVKASYKKFLHSFEDFYRKLGCTLLTTSRDNKLRSRSTRPLIRDRDKAPPEKLLEKEENISSNSDDNSETKIQINTKEKIEIESKEDVDIEIENNVSEFKKDNGKSRNKRDHSVETIKDEEKFKKKLDIPLVKDFDQVQLLNIKENKDEKSFNDKKNEKKPPIKSISKMEECFDKKNEKISLKTKTKRLKPVEKKIIKMEVTSTIRSKRTLKERMKAIVQKFKLKNVNNNENDKKKRMTSEDLNKMSQFGVKIKNKEDLLNNGAKSRKLSLGSNDGKILGTAGINFDKKAFISNNSATNIVSPITNVNNSFIKSKKSDEDLSESSRKKVTSRKKKDDDKFTNNSSESLINQAIEFVPHYKSIFIGDKLKVYYEPTHESKVTYEAKVTNKRYGTATEYLVHYTGWNTRYDEWIRRSRIADNLSWTPTRTKKKTNQTEPQFGNQTPTHQNELSPQQSQNNGKPSVDKSKRSSTSPIQKNRTKSTIKSGINKKIKSVKNKLEAKTKKISTQKGSDSSSESDSEIQKKQELQKTRSRTEKQKQQEGDPQTTKEFNSKKKPFNLKRTRSESLKTESNDSPIKRKNQSLKIEKVGKGGNIRNSLKSLVSRKRASNRIRDSSKDAKIVLDKNVDDADTVNYAGSDKEIEENIVKEHDMKNVIEENTRKSAEINNDSKETDDMLLILKIQPLNVEKIAELTSTLDTDYVNDTGSETETNHEIVKANEDSNPPVLKKEILIAEETNGTRTAPNQFLTGSYLSENLDSKPKIVKTKLKKEFDDKNVSPSKIFCRGSNEKNVTKFNNDMKEKTFFVSRSPTEKKIEKYEIGEKEKKENKLRNVNTLNSYLNVDKIDLLKKGNNVEKNASEKISEKQTVVQKVTKDPDNLKNEDDVYEFKEPEPFDERTIPHRRPVSRIFDDSNCKRQKNITFTSGIIVKDNSDLINAPEEMNINETKSILDIIGQKDDADELKSNLDKDFSSKNEKIIEIYSNDDAQNVFYRNEESNKVSPSCDGKKNALNWNTDSEDAEAELKNVEHKAHVATSEKNVNFGNTNVDKYSVLSVAETENTNEDEEDDDDYEDAEESKLVILENELPTGNVILVESSGDKEYFEKVKEIFATTTEKVKKQCIVGQEPNTIHDTQNPLNFELINTSDLKISLTDSSSKLTEKRVSNIPANLNVENEYDQKKNNAACVNSENVTNEPVPVISTLTEIVSKSVVSSIDYIKLSKDSGDSKEKNVTSATDTNGLSVEKTSKKCILEKLITESPTSTSQFPSVSTKMKIDDNSSEVSVVNPSQASKDADPDSDVVHHSIIDEVEIEIFTADKKNNTEPVGNTNEKNENSDITDEYSKSKDEEEEAVNNGLLLCEETIPKSPESKDTLHDVDVSYPSGSKTSSDSNKNIPEKQLPKLKKKSSSSSLFPTALNPLYENTPPSTPEGSNSTPGTSPSEENNGFSSTNFVLTEKSSFSKDFSENETCSDNSEKSLKIKKKYVEENYHKRNSSDYESYAKKKIEKDSMCKLDEPPKKKTKIYNSVSVTGSEKDELSDGENSPKTAASLQQTAVAIILSDCPKDLDSNQRIEYLEQKLHSIKKAYNVFKQEVATIDRRRKKLRRKEREGRMMTRNEANSLL